MWKSNMKEEASLIEYFQSETTGIRCTSNVTGTLIDC